MSWGIADTAPDIEKIKAESTDYLNGLNSCGVIDYSTYSNAFDFYADLLDKTYEQGQKDAERTWHWIPVTERLPKVDSVVLCYCKNRAWMVGKINVCKYCAADKYKDTPYFDYNMNGFPEVIAWMPLPEPYEEGGENV